MSRIRIIIKTSIEYGIKGTYLLKVTENSTSNSVFNVNSQPVFKTLLLTQLHLNEKESGWVHRMTDWLAMFIARASCIETSRSVVSTTLSLLDSKRFQMKSTGCRYVQHTGLQVHKQEGTIADTTLGIFEFPSIPTSVAALHVNNRAVFFNLL